VLFVTAIKTGRYTHAKKAKDIIEVKLLLAQKQQQKTSPSSAESYHDHVDDVSSPSTRDVSPALSPLPADVMQPASVASSSSSSPLATNDLEKIIEHITNVYLTQTPLTAEFIAALPQREKHYLVSGFSLLVSSLTCCCCCCCLQRLSMLCQVLLV